MVVFQCDGCGDSVKKAKAEQHVNTCRFCRALVCLDCMRRFTDDSYKQHTSCISEAQKYQGALYKPPKAKGKQQNPQQQQKKPEAKPQPPAQKRPREEEKPAEPVAAEVPSEKPAKKANKMHASKDFVALLAQKMTEAREEGESIEDLQARTQIVVLLD